MLLKLVSQASLYSYVANRKFKVTPAGRIQCVLDGAAIVGDGQQTRQDSRVAVSTGLLLPCPLSSAHSLPSHTLSKCLSRGC